MASGSIRAIFIAPDQTAPMSSVDQVQARAGLGLEGDRYFRGKPGNPRNDKAPEPDREVTLIESEAIEALPRDENLPFDLAESRRNLVTSDVPLNHLVGRNFRVGAVELRGIRLCEPCKHLESMTRPGVIKALLHRGGLRAQILTDGPIRVGDPVEYDRRDPLP